MGQPFTGEIRLFAGNFAPLGWAFCDGSLLSIGQYDALFNLIGTTYGGDGVQTFALPDLRGRVPVHQGTGAGATRNLGETGGSEAVTLTASTMPGHTYALVATTSIGNETGPANNLLGQSSVTSAYVGDTVDSALAPNSITQAGGSQPHENMGPFLTVSFIIQLNSIFPTQN